MISDFKNSKFQTPQPNLLASHVDQEDDELQSKRSGQVTNEHHASYVLCITEELLEEYPPNKAKVGIVAIECSTGTVLQSQVIDGPMRMEVESRLVFAKPSDLLIVNPISMYTRRLLENYHGTTKGIRVRYQDYGPLLD